MAFESKNNTCVLAITESGGKKFTSEIRPNSAKELRHRCTFTFTGTKASPSIFIKNELS